MQILVNAVLVGLNYLIKSQTKFIKIFCFSQHHSYHFGVLWTLYPHSYDVYLKIEDVVEDSNEKLSLEREYQGCYCLS